QRLREQPAVREVVQKRVEANVEHRTESVLQPIGVLSVRVPHGIVHGRIAWLARPVDVDEAHASFDQTPGQQARLAPGVPAVPITSLIVFLAQVEGRTGLSGSDQVKSLDRKSVPGFEYFAPAPTCEGSIQLANQV